MQQEGDGDSNGKSPFVGGGRVDVRRRCRTSAPREDESEQQEADPNRDALDKIVDKNRQAAAADTGEREVDAYQFWCFDAKLIPKFDRLAMHEAPTCSTLSRL